MFSKKQIQKENDFFTGDVEFSRKILESMPYENSQ